MWKAQSIALRVNCEDEMARKKTKGTIEFIGNYSCDRAVFVKDGKWGVLNMAGIMIVKPRFSHITSFYGGLAVVREESGTYGIIDKGGKFVLVPQRKVLGLTSEGMTAFTVDGPKRVYNIKGQQGELTKPSICGLWGFYDSNGEVAIDPEHLQVGMFSEGLCPVQRECKKVFEDKTKKSGESTKSTWLWGYMNKSGSIEIPCVYDKVKPFYQGRAVVKLDGEWIVIDQDGDKVEIS